MRDNAAIRKWVIDYLTSVLRRPSLHGDALAIECTLHSILSQLGFIDERDEAFDEERERLRSEGLHNAMGIRGALMAACGVREHELDEFVALVGARSAARLGYLAPSHRVKERDFRRFVDDFESCELDRLEHLVARLGAPLKEITTWTRLCGWAGPTDELWIAAGVEPDQTISFIMLLGSNHPVRRRVDETEEAIAAYRRFLLATLYGREEDLRPLIITRPDPAALWAGAYPPDVAQALARNWSSVDVMRVERPNDGLWLVSDACPIPLQLLRVRGRWLVDPEPLLRFGPPRADLTKN